MKAILLTASLVANVVLVVLFAWRPSRAPSSFRNYFAWGSASSAAAATPQSAPSPKPAVAGKADAPKLWSTLSTDDLHALVDRLRAAGFPVYAMRAILQSLLSERYDARMQAILQNDPAAPFWKATASLGMDSKRMAEYRQLASERSSLLRDLLGPFLYHDDGTLSSDDARRFGNLPQSKVDQLNRINADYSDLTSQVRASMNGVTLPEDREKLALLDREKRADLVALLTPEELADYDMRNSPITNRLRQTFDLFKVTDGEFRSIFAIQQAYSSRIDLGNFELLSPDERVNLSRQRAGAQKELEDQMRAALGDARYVEFARASDRDFQQLNRLAQRENLPAQTAIDAFNLRDHVSQESNRIFNDTNLSYDQKRASLESLAQNTRAQLLATLGPTAGDAYLKTANWLANVERGGSVTFNGTSTSFRNLPNPNGPRLAPGAGAVGGGSITGASGPVIIGGGTVIFSDGGNGGTTTVISTPAPLPTPTR